VGAVVGFALGEIVGKSDGRGVGCAVGRFATTVDNDGDNVKCRLKRASDVADSSLGCMLPLTTAPCGVGNTLMIVVRAAMLIQRHEFRESHRPRRG
jgi:hypothetical protein